MKQLNKEVVIPDTAPEGHTIVTIGPNVWGQGKTLDEALKNMYKVAHRKFDYEVHICVKTDGNPVDDMGRYYVCSPDKNCQYCK